MVAAAAADAQYVLVDADSPDEVVADRSTAIVAIAVAPLVIVGSHVSVEP